MKKRLTTLFVAIVAILFCSCEKGDQIRSAMSPSFITNYYICQSELQSGFSRNENTTTISIVAINGGEYCSIWSKKNRKAAYNALCAKHNDTSYNQNVAVGAGMGNEHGALYYDFVSVDIKCDSDIDANHKANASVNDLFSCRYISCKPYIDSGYNDSMLPDEINEYRLPCWTYCEKQVSELTPDDLTLLIAGGIIIRFITNDGVEIPDKSTITITLTTDEGKKFTTSTTLNFAK